MTMDLFRAISSCGTATPHLTFKCFELGLPNETYGFLLNHASPNPLTHRTRTRTRTSVVVY